MIVFRSYKLLKYPVDSYSVEQYLSSSPIKPHRDNSKNATFVPCEHTVFANVESVAVFVNVESLAVFVNVDSLADFVIVESLAVFFNFESLADFVIVEPLAIIFDVESQAVFVNVESLAFFVNVESLTTLRQCPAKTGPTGCMPYLI